MFTQPRTLPAKVAGLLLPDEFDPIVTRYHPISLAGPLVVAGGGAIIAGLLSVTWFAPYPIAVELTWLVWLFLLLRAVWKIMDWSVTYFVVTDVRLLEVKGIITERVGIMPMSKVTDIGRDRTFLGRMLNYCTFDLESAGQDQRLKYVGPVPWAKEMYLEITQRALIGPIRHPAPADDDGGL